jgi:hypothetical protein
MLTIHRHAHDPRDSGIHLSRGVNRPSESPLRVAHKPGDLSRGENRPECGENRCDSGLSRGENRLNY